MMPGASQLRRMEMRAAAEVQGALHDVGRTKGASGTPVYSGDSNSNSNGGRIGSDGGITEWVHKNPFEKRAAVAA